MSIPESDIWNIGTYAKYTNFIVCDHLLRYGFGVPWYYWGKLPETNCLSSQWEREVEQTKLEAVTETASGLLQMFYSWIYENVVWALSMGKVWKEQWRS